MLEYAPKIPKVFESNNYSCFAVKKAVPHTLEIEQLLQVHFPYCTNDLASQHFVEIVHQD